MSIVAQLLWTTVRHLRRKSLTGPAKSSCTPAAAAHRVASFNPPKSPAMLYFAKAYACSPLVRFDRPEAVDAIDVIFCDAAVQRAAAQCAQRLARLHDVIAIRSEIGGVIDGLAEDGDCARLTPSNVIAALNRRAEQIEAAIAEAREDKAAHDEAHRTRYRRLQPLRAAASVLHTRLAAERNGIDERFVAMKNASRLDGATERFEALRAQGLTSEQIVSLGVERPDLDAKAQAMRDRIAEIDPMIAKLKAFSDDVFASPDHLSGLGLDEVIGQVYPEWVTEQVLA